MLFSQLFAKDGLINSARESISRTITFGFLVISRLLYSRDLVSLTGNSSFTMCVLPFNSNNKCLHAHHRYAIVVRAIGMYQQSALQCNGHRVRDRERW